MADVTSPLSQWSTTASLNAPAGSANVGAGVDDNIREIQAVVRSGLAHYNSSPVASSGTTNIGAATGNFIDISGTTTISAFDSVSAGIWKVCRFVGSLTLTHNATTLILPGGANITTAAGDVAIFYSLGAGNWRCASYMRADGTTLGIGPISGLTTETVLAVDDFFPIYDTSATANRKITVQNVLNVVGSLTEETVPVSGDSLLLYDLDNAVTERTTVNSLATALSPLIFSSSSMATKADMEAATSTTLVVSPGRVHYHPRVAKYWARVAVTGASASISEAEPSGGSVSRNATGSTTVTLPVTMATATYGVVAMITGGTSGFIRAHSISTTQILISTQNAAGSDQDLHYSLIVFGDT